MSAKRAAPAFQVYAADDLASERFFGLPLAQRGLLDSMRRACWVSEDGSVPRDPSKLAIVVRRSETEIREALSLDVLSWFMASPDQSRLVDLELQRQLAQIDQRRLAQSGAAESTNRRARTKRVAVARATPVTGSVSEAVSATVSAAVTEAVSDPLLKRSETNPKESIGSAKLSLVSEETWARSYALAEPEFPVPGTEESSGS